MDNIKALALDRVIINLKNIMFFKFIIYSLSILALLWLLGIVQDDLTNSLEEIDKAQQMLSNINMQLKVVTGADNQALIIYDKYKNLLEVSNKKSCESRLELMRSWQNLTGQYNLTEPMQFKVSQSSFENIIHSVNNMTQIKHYNIRTQFLVDNFVVALSVIKSAYAIAPMYSFIEFVEIKKEDALTPELITKLAPTRNTNLIQVTFDTHIREIILQKY